jgi:hypothetical protein
VKLTDRLAWRCRYRPQLRAPAGERAGGRWVLLSPTFTYIWLFFVRDGTSYANPSPLRMVAATCGRGGVAGRQRGWRCCCWGRAIQ